MVPLIRRPARLLIACVLTAMSMVVRADVRQLVLHEFIPLDPQEDIALAATTPDGQLPAAMITRSGTVEAPNTMRMPTSTEHAYGPASQREGLDRFSPDRDTRRPTVNRYDDPFSPGIAPYKRLRAYDWVANDFSLTLVDASLSPIPEGGNVAADEDAFFGEMTVDLVLGEPVRIPTVGPGARVIRRSSQPRVALELMQDSAENWFALGAVTTRVRLSLQIAISEGAFGGAFGDSILGSRKRVPALPSSVAPSVEEVVRTLGLRDERSARAAVGTLVSYFRGFEPSDDAPRGRANIYLDLALSRKGVCRHRAYAFVVTALGMGIPARMVHNEAHAWVEVHDGVMWKRIDLGGASTPREQNEEFGSRPMHSGASDPFSWPEGHQPEHADNQGGNSGGGRAAAQAGQRADDGARQVRVDSSMTDPLSSVDDSEKSAGLVSLQDPVLSGAPGAVALVPATIRLVETDTRVLRGSPMKVEGDVFVDAQPCGLVRVNVFLRDPKTTRWYGMGAVTSDDHGHFSGSVVVPLEMQVGEYDVVIATPGDSRCGPGTSGP